MDFKEAGAVLKDMGVRGAVKSAYHSYRHTGSPRGLVLGKGVSVSISRHADIDLESELLLGIDTAQVMHRNLGDARLYVSEEGSLSVTTPDRAHIGSGTLLNIQGDFRIGDAVIDGLTRILCRNHVEIGDDSGIAWDVDILDTDGGHPIYVDGTEQTQDGPVVIGEHVMVCHKVTILPDVTIGDGAVVASNTLVTEDVPPGTLVGGIPARVIEDDIEWEW